MSVKSYLKTNNKDDKFKQYNNYNTIENWSNQKRTTSTEDNNSTSKIMNYDDVLEELGEMGPWQILNLFLLWLPSVAGGMWVLTYSFAGKI